MIQRPSLEQLLTHVDSKFTLVSVARLRADDILSGSRPLIETDTEKPLSIAFEEIAEGKIKTVQTDHPRKRRAPSRPVREYDLAA